MKGLIEMKKKKELVKRKHRGGPRYERSSVANRVSFLSHRGRSTIDEEPNLCGKEFGKKVYSLKLAVSTPKKEWKTVIE